MDSLSKLTQIDNLIRDGKISQAKSILLSIKLNQIKRIEVSKLADFARRLRMNLWGLRLLRPLVRSEQPVHPAVTEEELVTYAGLLIKIGAHAEARELLKNRVSTTNPSALLFQSQLLFAEWNYLQALPLLAMGQKLKTIPNTRKLYFK